MEVYVIFPSKGSKYYLGTMTNEEIAFQIQKDTMDLFTSFSFDKPNITRSYLSIMTELPPQWMQSG